MIHVIFVVAKVVSMYVMLITCHEYDDDSWVCLMIDNVMMKLMIDMRISYA